jgi:hypothetical protein
LDRARREIRALTRDTGVCVACWPNGLRHAGARFLSAKASLDALMA